MPFLTARAFKEGVEIHKVNPAYISIIGRINFAKRYGLSKIYPFDLIG
jgi:hypothetical protein